MPTIKQLPAATSVSATDVVPVSQGGTTRSLSIGNMLSSTQPAIALTPGKLLGRASPTSGGPEPVTVGTGLAVTSGVIAATGEDHKVLPVASGLAAGDEVVVNSGGVAQRMQTTLLRGLFSAGTGVTIDGAGTISAIGGAGSGPATATSVGAVKPGAALAVASDGTMNVQFGAGAAAAYSDPRIVSAEPLAAGDLRRFGWVGDGRDETSVFAAALAALPASGGHIVIPDSPSGTTLGAITIDRPVTIRGEGGPGGQTLLRPATPTTTMFTVTAPFVTIECLTIGPINPSIAKQTGGTYIKVMPTASRFRAVRLTLNEFHEGITIAGDVPTVELLNIFGFLYSTGLSQSTALLHFQGGLDVRVNGMTANGPGTGSADVKAGVWVESLGDGTITNADIIAMGTDLLVNPGNGQGVTSLWICDSFLDTAERGADWMPTGTGQIARCRMSNVWSSSHRLEGIRIGARVDGLDIDSPHVFLNGSDGIAMQGGKNVRVRGGQIAQNAGNGMSVSAGLSDWSIEGVTVGATGGLSGNAGFGVYVSQGASDRYRISGNSMVSNGSGGVADNGTGTHKTSWNNIGNANDYFAYRDEASGVLKFVGRQSTYSGFVFATDDGQEHFRVDAAGAAVNGSRVIHAGALGTGLSWNGTTLSATAGLSPATASSIGGVKPDGTTIAVAADGTISMAGVAASALSGSMASSDTVLVVRSGTPYTATLAQLQAALGSGTALTAATIAGAPGSGTVGTAVTGLTCTLTPSNATAYASLKIGSTEQTPRTVFTGTAVPALTPASAGSATISIYAAASGGTALGTSGVITVASAGATSGTIGIPTGATTVGQASSFSITANAYPAWVSISQGGTEQMPRTQVGAAGSASMTPSAAGSSMASLYASATGGSAIAASGAFTVAAGSGTSGTIGAPGGTPTSGQASSFAVTASAYPAWVSISQGGTEQLPRTQVSGAGNVSVTPTTSGLSTASLYGASTGGSAIATTGAFTVAAAGGTAYAFVNSGIGANIPASGSFGGGAAMLAGGGNFKCYIKDGSGNHPASIQAVWTRSGTVVPTADGANGTGWISSPANGADFAAFTLYNDGGYPGLYNFDSQRVYRKAVSGDATAGVGNYYLWARCVDGSGTAGWIVFATPMAVSN